MKKFDQLYFAQQIEMYEQGLFPFKGKDDENHYIWMRDPSTHDKYYRIVIILYPIEKVDYFNANGESYSIYEIEDKFYISTDFNLDLKFDFTKRVDYKVQ